MELSSSSWLSDLALMDDSSLIHQGELSTLDQLTSHHIAAALDDDFQNSISAESHTSYPIFATRSKSTATNAVLARSPTAAGAERPAKLPKTSSWNQRFLAAAMAPSFPRILSFGRPDAAEDPPHLLRSFVGVSAQPEEAGLSTISSMAAQAGRRAPNSGSRPPSHAHDHLIAERKRRERISEMFIALSAVVPGLKKMDKASVLGDAIKYVKQLEQQVKAFEEQAAKRTVESVVLVKRSQLLPSDDDISSSGENSDGTAAVPPSGEYLPDVEAKVSDRSVLLRIHCEQRKGLLVRVMEEVEKLQLSVVNASVIPFAGSALDITVMAQASSSPLVQLRQLQQYVLILLSLMEEEFSMTVKDLVKHLNSACREFM
ncbi:hypothetical protein Taro_023706 [Colocasia esculenta]|uniref:BHLH domain-containing protein n=1 Tax=Colocasia esculenta TaxID=4460 RepID=A0A843VBK5_COLES|nr:hypothetical protein [Colocasia esculenta]